ncbi:MAG: hypothetical protein H7240_01235 [Glaciimonas sp.]|nr:hypothetical protein [Glaciimonas sp.]
MKEYIKIFLLSALPAILLFAGRSGYVSGYFDSNGLLPASVTKPEFEFFCFLAGIIISSTVLPYQLIKAKQEIKEKDKLLVDIVVFNKENFVSSIKSIIKKPGKDLRTRLFVPEPKGLLQKVRRKANVFILKDISGLSDPLNAKHLKFQVSPISEGVIGRVYSQRTIITYHHGDEDASGYSLDDYQKLNTSDIRFICAGPIFNKKSEIVAVLAVDSTTDCNMDSKALDNCKLVMARYCSFVGVNVNL